MWNCKGIGKDDTVNFLKNLVQKHILSSIFLMKIKCDKTRIQKVCKTMEYFSSFAIDSIGNAGGLALIWADLVTLNFKWNQGRIICGEIVQPNDLSQWDFYACYEPPYTSEKRNFWNQLGAILENFKLSRLILGDLNEVMNEDEKLGGRPLWRKKLYLKPVMQSIEAIDLGFKGKRFTWENNQEGRS